MNIVKEIIITEKTTKRARNGEGHIRKRNNRWEIQCRINNERKSLYGDTKAEVEKKYLELKHQEMTGSITQFSKVKYSVWFETWINEYKSIMLKPKTLQSYRELYNLYIRDSNISSMNIQDINTHKLQLFINSLIKLDLSSRTINYIKTLIHGSFEQAVKNGFIANNPAAAVSTPRADKKDPRVLSVEEQQDFMDSLTANRYKFLFYFDLSTGLRTGELLGLQWKDIDFNNKSFSVKRNLNLIKDPKTGKSTLTYGSPKTKKSMRTIPLSDVLIKNLLKHKDLQKAEMLRAGDFWLGKSGNYFDDNNVFLTDKGTPIFPSTLRHLIIRSVKKINKQRMDTAMNPNDVILMEHFSMHTLRHTFATRALESKVPPKVVQEILGHSSITVTLDLYSHVLPNTKQYYMEQIIDVSPFDY